LITPSLLGLPRHQLGFGLEYEAWLIFDSVNNPDPRYKPLSLGRMSPFDAHGSWYVDPITHDSLEYGDGICDGAQTFDSRNPYTDPFYFDSNFAYPGEDFVENLPNGLQDPLDLFNLPDVERVKLWITMEPLHYPEFGITDWAPDMPFTQLVTYVADLVPDLETDTLTCDRALPLAPPTYNIPLQYRPISRNRSDAAEGNDWPTMMFFISSPLDEK
jgi:hypothetical protein